MWDKKKPGELIAVWDSVGPVSAPDCFDTQDEPDLLVPAGQHPIEGQFWLDGLVNNARIWIPDAKVYRRRPIGIYVSDFALEFHDKKNSPVILLPDVEFFDEPGFNLEGGYGIRRIDLGRRVTERHIARENEDDD